MGGGDGAAWHGNRLAVATMPTSQARVGAAPTTPTPAVAPTPATTPAASVVCPLVGVALSRAAGLLALRVVPCSATKEAPLDLELARAARPPHG